MTTGRAFLALVLCVLVPLVVPAQEDDELGEVARQLNNPVAELWSLKFQNDFFFLRGNPAHAYRGQLVTKFQPVMPLGLTEDWNLIVRPVFAFLNTPTLESDGDIDRTSGIGETSVIALLSPARVKGLLWGVGPSVIIPTTTRDELSQRKYAIGPAAVALHMSEKWTLGIFPQYWWSVSGSNRRREVSQANIQYFIWRNLPNQWQIGMSPNILYDRKADGGDAWTVPIGLGVQKTTRMGGMPVKFELQAQAMIIHPDDYGQRFGLRFSITPVIPKLIKGHLLE
jgi:hypothetical protein